MDKLSNSFALLDLDSQDSKGETSIATHSCDIKDFVDKGMENGSEDGSLLTPTPGEYKMPLVWIDLEMTGLNVEVDRILEIACVITDGNLTKSIEGPDLVIHQTKECLDKMGEWCVEHHAESGLTEKVLQSTISEQEAEKQLYLMSSKRFHQHFIEERWFYACTKEFWISPEDNVFLVFSHPSIPLFVEINTALLILFTSANFRYLLSVGDNGQGIKVIEFVNRHVGTYTPLIAGNSVYMDLLFLRKYMPDVAALFSHVIVDVSSVKALCLRWYPRDKKRAPKKENKHRALDDIKESIAELKFYKEHIFKPKSKK